MSLSLTIKMNGKPTGSAESDDYSEDMDDNCSNNTDNFLQAEVVEAKHNLIDCSNFNSEDLLHKIFVWWGNQSDGSEPGLNLYERHISRLLGTNQMNMNTNDVRINKRELEKGIYLGKSVAAKRLQNALEYFDRGLELLYFVSLKVNYNVEHIPNILHQFSNAFQNEPDILKFPDNSKAMLNTCISKIQNRDIDIGTSAELRKLDIDLRICSSYARPVEHQLLLYIQECKEKYPTIKLFHTRFCNVCSRLRMHKMGAEEGRKSLKLFPEDPDLMGIVISQFLLVDGIDDKELVKVCQEYLEIAQWDHRDRSAACYAIANLYWNMYDASLQKGAASDTARTRAHKTWLPKIRNYYIMGVEAERKLLSCFRRSSVVVKSNIETRINGLTEINFNFKKFGIPPIKVISIDNDEFPQKVEEEVVSLPKLGRQKIVKTFRKFVEQVVATHPPEDGRVTLINSFHIHLGIQNSDAKIDFRKLKIKAQNQGIKELDISSFTHDLMGQKDEESSAATLQQMSNKGVNRRRRRNRKKNKAKVEETSEKVTNIQDGNLIKTENIDEEKVEQNVAQHQLRGVNDKVRRKRNRKKRKSTEGDLPEEILQGTIDQEQNGNHYNVGMDIEPTSKQVLEMVCEEIIAHLNLSERQSAVNEAGIEQNNSQPESKISVQEKENTTEAKVEILPTESSEELEQQQSKQIEQLTLKKLAKIDETTEFDVEAPEIVEEYKFNFPLTPFPDMIPTLPADLIKVVTFKDIIKYSPFPNDICVEVKSIEDVVEVDSCLHLLLEDKNKDVLKAFIYKYPETDLQSIDKNYGFGSKFLITNPTIIKDADDYRLRAEYVNPDTIVFVRSHQPRQCRSCFKDNLNCSQFCEKCKKSFYCSRECEKIDLALKHKAICFPHTSYKFTEK